MMTSPLLFSPIDIIQQVKLLYEMPTMIEALAKRRIIQQTAQSMGITVELDELQKASDSLRIKHQILGTEATWEWLNRHHLTLEDFEELARMTILSGKLAKHLFEAKVDLFFGQHYLDYSQVAFYEIKLKDYNLAMELYYGLQEQEFSFSDVINRYCDDVEHRRRGGYRGTLKRSELSSDIANVIFTAQPPELLKPIQSDQQCHLIRVEDIIRPSLDESLRRRILTELFSKWLKKQLKKTDIKILAEAEVPLVKTSHVA